jgi:DNA-binding transcriptional regulator YdaS (Cro superfamily)
MNLSKYLEELPRGGASKFASILGVSSSFLYQMAAGSSVISPQRAIEIEVATDGVVTRADCRPHDWQKIWPEYNPARSEAA